MRRLQKNMNPWTKAKMYLPLLAILVVGLLSACGTSATVTPPSDESLDPPEVASPSDEPLGPTDRVDVVYFHRPRRCVTCLCFEERISYVVKTYFQDELASGKLTFEIFNLGDNENAVIANKYGAVGSQLFINTIRDGIDHITDIQDIWGWGCTSNEEAFDNAVRSAIAQSLNGEE